MRTARVEQSIGSQRATRLCSIVEPSELDETLPPIGKLIACDDNSYLSRAWRLRPGFLPLGGTGLRHRANSG